MAISSAALLIVLIALPFGGSCLAALFPRNARNAETYLAGGIALAALALVVAIYPQVVEGGVVQYRAPWIPDLGLEFNLRMDGFAWVLAALITGIGFLVVLYARYYMSPADPVPRFYSFLLAFMGAMLGIVLSGNLIQLVFFLGTNQPFLVSADRLPAPDCAGAGWRAHGAHRHVGRRALLVRRHTDAWAYRRQLRP